MENKVIAKEYVNKNYVHKDIIKKVINEEVEIIKQEKEVYYYPENVIDIILEDISKKLVEDK